ncbi:MAG: PilZ domain-containing protein [Terriglobia bacterium]|jgi:hypothetical protein
MADRRKVPRYDYGMKGRLHPAGGGVGTNVVVGVISMQGCSLESGQDLEVGRKCELYLDWQGSDLGFEAQVVAKEADGTLGLRFLSVDRESQQRLSELCNALRLRPPTAATPEIEHAPLPSPETATPLADGPVVISLPAGNAASPAALRERRRVPRYISELRAHLTNVATGAGSNVRLITLSILGGCLTGPEAPEAGQPCDLNTEWNGKPLRLPARVIWKSREGCVGVKFSSLEPPTEQLLREICSNLRLQPPAPLPRPD